jgi:hypothetical protein
MSRSTLIKAGSMLLATSACGCLSAGVFTSARVLPPGEVEHVAALDVPVSFAGDVPRDAYGGQVRPATRLSSAGGPQPTYALRMGALSRVELGGRIAPTSLEVSAKVGVLDGRSFAAALAPRITSAGFFPADSPYYARLPLLLTFDVTERASLTPRVGAGVTLGRPKLYDGDFDTLSRSTRDPFVECGVTLILPVRSRTRVALEAYVLSAPREGQTTGGLGFGVLWGSPR